MNKKTEIKYILLEIRNQLKQDVIPSIDNNSETGGFFPVPLILFSFIELLGILYKNPSEKKGNRHIRFFTESHAGEAVKYIKKYMEKIRPEYKKFGRLLYGVYRNSLSHCYIPTVIEIDKNTRLGWAISKNSKKDLHLKLRKGHYVDPCTKKIHSCINLQIDINRFYQDVLDSIDKFEEDAMIKPTIMHKIVTAYNKLNRQRSLSTFGKKIQKEIISITN